MSDAKKVTVVKEALEGMAQKSSKPGDGRPWTPTITVKGGTSGFYSIGVTK